MATTAATNTSASADILASLGLAISIFTATQFQFRVGNYSFDGAPLSVWKANTLVGQWLTRRELAKKQLESAQKVQVDAAGDLHALGGNREDFDRAIVFDVDLATRLVDERSAPSASR